MTDTMHLSAGFMFLSGVIGLGLLFFALKGYRRTRNPQLAFVAAAFTLFALKSFVVGYAILYGTIEHETLELLDAMGDLGTVFLIVVPLLIPPRGP